MHAYLQSREEGFESCEDSFMTGGGGGGGGAMLRLILINQFWLLVIHSGLMKSVLG